ncbi:fibronectin type III domain-containing protein [Spirosoma gilvum]
MHTRFLLLLLLFLVIGFRAAYADCQAPGYTSTNTITHQSASLSWFYYGSGPPTYQVHWRTVGTTAWTTGPVQTNTVMSLTGLANNTAYEWQVRSICAAGDTSSYSTTTTFQTQCIQPYYTSVTNVTHQSVRLSWALVTGGASYEVQWRPAGTTDWTIVSGLTTGVLDLTGLPDETAFEWRVRTVCSVSATSDYVNGSLFRTRCLPPSNARTTLVNPNAAELKWDSPVTNGIFDLQWRPAGTTNWTLIEGIVSTEYILTGLTNNTSYEWQVRTACSATSKSLFTSTQVFQTNCQLPTNLGFSAVSHNLATLIWLAPASDLQWRKAGTADWTTVLAARPPYSLTGLANNTTYEWRVRTVCAEGATSDYTPSQFLTTQCATPIYPSGYSNATNGADLSWYSPSGGPFDVQWRPAGTTTWSTVSGILTASYSLSGLTAATVYEWRVRKVCSATDFSDFTSAQIVQVVCGGPTNLNFVQNSSGTVNLSWNATEPVARYEVQWRVANTTAWTTASGITSAGYVLSNLQLNTSYEWRVRKLCSDQVMSSYVNGSTFTFSCGQPTYFYVNDITISSARVSWYGSAVYSPFELQYRQAGSANWTAIPGLTTTTYSLSGLTNNTGYEWRVRSTCPSGGPNDFSSIQSFQTQCGPPLSDPSVALLDGNAVKLNWFYASSHALYEIQYRPITGGNWIVLQPDGTETDPNFGGSDWNYYQKQYTIYGLTAGLTYEWRVRALCAPSVYTDYLYGPLFTAGCSVPQYVNAYQQTNTSISVSWSSQTFVTGYDLQWRVAGTTPWSTISGLTNTGYVLTDLTPGATYEVRVRQGCSSGVTGDFSGIVTTQLQCIIPALTGSETLSGTSVRLSWSYYNLNGNDAINLSHDLQYRVSGTSTWTLVTGIVGTTYSLTGLTTGSSYEWQVRAACSAGITSGFSYSSYFGLSCAIPYGPSTQIGPTSAVLSWTNTGLSSQRYQLRWRMMGSVNWSALSVSSTTYSLTGLTNGTSYEWQVASDCGAGYLSDFSPVVSFQTNCPSVQTLSVDRVSSTGARLSWSGSTMPPQVAYSVQYRVSGTVIWSEVSGVTSTSVLLSGLAPKTSYEWRVRTLCETATAAFSTNSTFITQCSGLTNYSLYGVTAQSAIISWLSGSDYTAVNLQWRTISSNSTWNEANGLTGSVYSLVGLSPSTTYEYRIQGVCAANDLSPFSGNTFLTASVNSSSTFYVNTDSLTSQAARLNWSGAPDQTNFIVQWRVSGGSWTTTGPLSTKKYLLTGLTPSTNYEARVSYVGDNGATYVAVTSFTTPCPRVSNTYTNLIRPTSALLTWVSVNLPMSLQWRIAGTTTWNSVTGLTGNTYSLTGLTNNTLYEWRIQTYCSASITNVTYPVTFRTLCQMPVPMYTANITATSARLTWSGSALNYSVRYRAVGANTWITIPDLTATNYTLTGLATNVIYEWAVATNCESGISTVYTSPIRFTTQCSTPFYVSVNSSASDRVRITWEGAESTYQLQWRVVGSLDWTSISDVTSPYTLTGLTADVSYEVRIRSTCAIASNGPFAQTNSFSPRCTNYYPEEKVTDKITSSTAQLTWTVNPLMTYGLRWRVRGDNAWSIIPGVVTSPYTLTGLTNNTAYEWQLRTECQPGYGSSQIFQTTCGVPGGLRAQPITATSVNLYWNSSGENVPYELQWRPVGVPTWTTISGITSTSYTLTNLTNYPNYEWQVRSQCSGGSGFQLTASFKLADDCTFAIYTIRTGSWDDPTVWSCNRVPAPTDQVQVNHGVTIPAGYAAKAAVVRYAVGAQLTFGAGATVQFGN